MKVKIKALQSFAHGALLATPECEYLMNKGDADELAKAGFLQILPPDEHPPKVIDSAELDELIGGEKMDADVENKMDVAPANKVTSQKQKKSHHKSKRSRPLA